MGESGIPLAAAVVAAPIRKLCPAQMAASIPALPRANLSSLTRLSLVNLC